MDNIPYGYCQCGCGQKTNIAKQNIRVRGLRKGEPSKYLRGHADHRSKQQIERRLSQVKAYRNQWQAGYPNIPYGFCQCGCGQKTSIAIQTQAAKGCVQGEPRRFITGHRVNLDLPEHDYIEEDRGYKTPCWIWQRTVTMYGYAGPCTTIRF